MIAAFGGGILLGIKRMDPHCLSTCPLDCKLALLRQPLHHLEGASFKALQLTPLKSLTEVYKRALGTQMVAA